MRSSHFKKYILFYCFLVFFWGCNDTARANPLKIDLSLKTPDKHNNYDQNHLAYILLRAKDMKVIFHHNATKPFIPASTTKILTIAAGLRTIGFNHKFTTELAYNGTIENNKLVGDLYLIGGGDPTLKIKDLITFVEKLRENNIFKVHGQFFVDNSYLEFQPQIDNDMSIDAHYNQALSALSVNYNVILTRWHYNWRKRSYQFISTPELASMSILPSSQQFLEPRNFHYQQKNDTDYWSHDLALRKHARSHSKYLPVKRPAIYTGEILRNIAQQHAIEVPMPQKKQIEGNRLPLHNHKSSDFIYIGGAVLDFSSNLLADTILLHLGNRLSQKKVSLAQSAKLLSDYLRKNLPGINWNDFHLENGSGLTSQNRISAAQMAAVLKWASNKTYNSISFRTLLPISGTKGSLTNRLYTSDYAYRVFAKTGAIDYAVALAGYFLGLDGNDYIFAQFYMHPEKRKYISDHNNKTSAKLRRLAPRWGALHRAKIDARLKEWLKADLSRN